MKWSGHTRFRISWTCAFISRARKFPTPEERCAAASTTEQKTVRVLQPAILGGKTQFLLDMAEISDYDRITLTVRTKNYVAHARVDGQDDPHGPQWANLGTTTLFDLSDEKLGRNSVLQIPVSTYKYLRVTVDGLVNPSDILGATAGIERAQEAVWRNLSSEPKQTQEGKNTVLTFTVPANVPVERVMLAIDPAQGNFVRGIEMQGEKDITAGAGEISRIHMQRNGGKIDVDQTWLTLTTTRRRHAARSHSQRRRRPAQNYQRTPAAIRAADLFRLRCRSIARPSITATTNSTRPFTITQSYSSATRAPHKCSWAPRKRTPPIPDAPTTARGPSAIPRSCGRRFSLQ